MANVMRQQLMAQLAVVRDQLAEYGLRGMPDYAEALVADALDGRRVESGVNRGFDVVAPQYGRVEVKCRRLPSDGRWEDRIDLRDSKVSGFDHLAIVVFYPNYDVKGAILVPYSKVWPIVDSRKYHRIAYREACELEGAVDISEPVSAAAQR